MGLLLLTGCDQQEKPRQYAQLVTPPHQQQVPAVMDQKAPDNPHAGLDMANITPEARAQLQKMLAEGQDPHAGIDMAAFGGRDPHAGLDMPAAMGNAPAVSSPYAWVLPKGWKQGPNKGMRLASFYLADNPDAVDCYIVSLPGIAGGTEANLKRWMGQIGVDPSDANYQKLLSGAQTIRTQGGLETKFYDLMSLQAGPSNKSMIASVISTAEATVFVKMTGTSADVKKNKDSFLELVKSLALK